MATKKNKLSRQQLEALIKTVSLDSSAVRFSKHALTRMDERGITRARVLKTLQKGRIKMTPEPNPACGSIECRMEHTLAEDHLSVVVAISDDEPHLIVVTAF